MSESPPIDALNEQQKEAVFYRAAPLLVLAGPGSGKTSILTQRIAWLISDKAALPESILAVTFTNRAAQEMEERLTSALGDTAGDVWIYTFHATAVRILRRFGSEIGIDPQFVIVDEDEQRHIINRVLRRLGLSREHYSIGQVVSYISQRKNALQDPTEPLHEIEPALVDIAGAYQALLEEYKALDFDDLIRYAVALLRTKKQVREHFGRTLKHILVDEFQDINTAQYELLSLLMPLDSSITIVADDDQSIYGWRGSQPELIDQFIERYRPHIVKLELSYRCPGPILYGAQRLITYQRSQERQRFMRSATDGEAPIFHYIFHDIHQEQRWLIKLIGKLIDERQYLPGDIAVLYRTHRLANPVEQALLQADYQVRRLRKESFFDQPIARDVVRYLQLVRSLSDTNLSGAMNFPRRQIDELTMLQLHRLANTANADLVEICRRVDEYPELSPLTRAVLRQFLLMAEEQLPALNDPADEAMHALFGQLEALRSPWREEDRKLLEGFLRFVDLAKEAELLADAIDEGQAIHILSPDSVDGKIAAFILHSAISTYLGYPTMPIADESEVDSLPEDALILSIGRKGEVAGSIAETIHLPPQRLGDALPYSLSIYAWRLAQALLLDYETQADSRYVIYDIETTGTNVRRDEIVEISASVFENQSAVEQPYDVLVRPQRGYIPRAATRVHGIHYEEVADAPTIEQVIPEFLDYVGDDTVVGHNIARFDNRFIDRAVGDLQDGKGFTPLYLDTLRLARRLIPDLDRHTLDYLVRELGFGEGTIHRAGSDLRHTARLFYALSDLILDEKEREALSEYLPLVAVSLRAAAIPEVDEIQSLLAGAVRIHAAAGESGLLDEFMDQLPPEQHDRVKDVWEDIAGLTLPVTPEDEAWQALRDDFFDHISAFQRYSRDGTLAAFLDYQALLNSIDTFTEDQRASQITLMTLHNAKGTEYPIVIIVGVEQENLPLWRTLNDPEQVAEERRVLYVGITRARDGVYLFSTRDRNDGFLRSPSRFAFDIPPEYVRRFRIDKKNRIEEM